MALVTKGDFDEIVNSSHVQLGIGATYLHPTDIDTKGAEEITVQVINGDYNSGTGSITGGDSTSVIVNVYGYLGTTFSSVPIGMMELTNNTSDVMFVNPGCYKIKLEIKNNGSASSYINYKVVVKR